ncbi:hypothetical protein KKG51_01025 [Patescibacteria group bacterium]|nr:hypothetical protein [Patescibacteria group bacterium]
MNYQNLKVVLEHIKKNVRCPHCEVSYPEHTLNIAETFENGALIVGICEKCRKPALIEVMIMSDPRPINKDQIRVKTMKSGPVTDREIDELSRFLQEFNGDFKTLFTK